jgi:ABC-type transporter Mla subunit MlaD
MNKHDRAELTKVIEHLEQAKAIVELIKDTEQEKFENLSEGLQQAENGQKLAEAAQALEQAYDNIESAIDQVNESTS